MDSIWLPSIPISIRYRSTPFDCVSSHFVPFHSFSFQFILIHSISFQFCPFHGISWYFMAFHVISWRPISFHFFPFHSNSFHFFHFILIHSIFFHVTVSLYCLRRSIGGLSTVYPVLHQSISYHFVPSVPFHSIRFIPFRSIPFRSMPLHFQYLCVALLFTAIWFHCCFWALSITLSFRPSSFLNRFRSVGRIRYNPYIPIFSELDCPFHEEGACHH